MSRIPRVMARILVKSEHSIVLQVSKIQRSPSGRGFVSIWPQG